MKLDDYFAFRANQDDLQRLARLAAALGRSRGDTIRYLLRLADEALAAPPAEGEPSDD